MEIEIKNIQEARKLLSKIPYNPTGKIKSSLFFPIDASAALNNDEKGIILTEKADYGSGSYLKAGLILERIGGKTIPYFGYCTTEYAKEFDLRTYLQVLSKMNEKEISKLAEYKCYFVNDSYLMAEFDMEPGKTAKRKEKLERETLKKNKNK